MTKTDHNFVIIFTCQKPVTYACSSLLHNNRVINEEPSACYEGIRWFLGEGRLKDGEVLKYYQTSGYLGFPALFKYTFIIGQTGSHYDQVSR